MQQEGGNCRPIEDGRQTASRCSAEVERVIWRDCLATCSGLISYSASVTQQTLYVTIEDNCYVNSSSYTNVSGFYCAQINPSQLAGLSSFYLGLQRPQVRF